MRSRKILFVLSWAFIFVGSIRLTNGAIGELAEVCNATCMKIREIVAESPFVVAVYAEKGVDPKQKSRKFNSIGSGIVKKLEGGAMGILTNNHVVSEPIASRIWVSFYQKGFLQEVAIIGRDPAADLALLSSPELPQGIVPATFAKRLELGQQVYALGYPFGVRRPTFGYVNTLESVSWLYAWTQAPVNPGNSGGPVFNEKHEVVGINTAIIQGATTTFVLPVEHVNRILPRLSREGIVRHAGAGFVFNDASHIPPFFFEELGLKYPPAQDSVMVYEVEPNSQAARAGIRKGDSILKFNGMAVKSAKDLDMKMFFDHHPDEAAVFTTKRGTQAFERELALVEYISVFKDQETR